MTTSTISFRGRPDDLGLSTDEMVRRAWDLPALEDHYAQLVDRFGSVDPDTDAEHLVALLDLDRELQELLVNDPHIPSSLTPDWTGRTSAAALLKLRRDWHPRAEKHWHTVIASHI